MRYLKNRGEELKYALGIGVDLTSESDESLKNRYKYYSTLYFSSIPFMMATSFMPIKLFTAGLASFVLGIYLDEKAQKCKRIMMVREANVNLDEYL